MYTIKVWTEWLITDVCMYIYTNANVTLQKKEKGEEGALDESKRKKKEKSSKDKARRLW